ncbi:hypothetical protein ACVOMV_27660 (plasmid) [Mesorhizobium atlanticum]
MAASALLVLTGVIQLIVLDGWANTCTGPRCCSRSWRSGLARLSLDFLINRLGRPCKSQGTT